jgi:hypothetical protein
MNPEAVSETRAVLPGSPQVPLSLFLCIIIQANLFVKIKITPKVESLF